MGTAALEFADISKRLASSATSLRACLQEVVDLAPAVVDGCDGATITLETAGVYHTPVWTEPLLFDIDTMQYSSGEGPCLDALAHGSEFYASDLENDPRWTVFGPSAASRGMRSLLSFGLGSDDLLASLNLYARGPGAYTKAARLRGLIFSTHAGLAVEAADKVERTTRIATDPGLDADKLERALRARQVIDEAKGIVMHREQVDSEEAFTMLRERATHMNMRLADLARIVIEMRRTPSPSDLIPSP